jgi:hypothetical protein
MFTQHVLETHLWKAIPAVKFSPPLGDELNAKMEGTTNKVAMCIAQAPVQA